MTTVKHLRQRKARIPSPIYIRIPSQKSRHSKASGPCTTLQNLTNQLNTVAKRFQKLQELIDANEEKLRKKRENLNALLDDLEKEAINESCVQQRIELLERCFCLLQERRVFRR